MVVGRDLAGVVRRRDVPVVSALRRAEAVPGHLVAAGCLRPGVELAHAGVGPDHLGAHRRGPHELVRERLAVAGAVLVRGQRRRNGRRDAVLARAESVDVEGNFRWRSGRVQVELRRRLLRIGQCEHAHEPGPWRDAAESQHIVG